jgi:ArsR family transcriptional regulator
MRIRILDALREGPLPVGEISRRLGLDQPVVSQQLAVLRGQRFVQGTREGTTVRYAVTDPAIWKLLDAALDIFENHLVSVSAELDDIRKAQA